MIRRFKKLIGFEYELNKISLIIQLITMTKENVQFSNADLKKLISVTSNYFDTVSRNLDNPSELFGDLYTSESFNTNANFPFYKFIPKEIYNNLKYSPSFRPQSDFS